MTEHAETADAESEEPVPKRPRAHERGKMRRRLRRQREVREALLLDLGALVFELHRQGRREPELLQAKAAELTAVDDEVRALADALDERLSLVSLAAAGISATCDECGTILAADARFCHNCGHAAQPGLERPEGEAAAAEPEAEAAVTAVEVAPEPEPVAEEAPEPEPEPEAPPESEPEAAKEEEDPAEPQAPWLVQEPEPEPEPSEPVIEPAGQDTREFDAAPWLEPSEASADPAEKSVDVAPAPTGDSEAAGEAPTESRQRDQSRVERFLRGKKR